MIQYNKSTNRYNSRFYSHFSTHSLLSPPMTTSIFYLILPSRLLELRVAELSCWLFVSRRQATSLPAHCMCYLLHHLKMIWQCMRPSIRLDQCTYPKKKVFTGRLLQYSVCNTASRTYSFSFKERISPI